MEEKLDLILSELQKVNGRLDSLETKVDRIEREVKQEFTAIHECFNVLYDNHEDLKKVLEIKVLPVKM